MAELVTGESDKTQQRSRPANSAHSSDRAPARSGELSTQNASPMQSASGTRRAENSRPVSTEADASTSVAGEASANISTVQ